ncbi:MAG TPA: hypothetical protein P5136_02615 [Methanofastidiosum sp.]|nr:hypothetical protein [Methanofastidiosum sp.]
MARPAKLEFVADLTPHELLFKGSKGYYKIKTSDFKESIKTDEYYPNKIRLLKQTGRLSGGGYYLILEDYPKITKTLQKKFHIKSDEVVIIPDIDAFELLMSFEVKI